MCQWGFDRLKKSLIQKFIKIIYDKMRFSSVNWTLYLDVENNCVCKSFLLKTMSAALSQINRFQFLYSRNLTLLFPLFFAATPVALSPSVFRRSKLIKRASSFANQGPNQMTRFWIQKLSISLIFLFFFTSGSINPIWVSFSRLSQSNSNNSDCSNWTKV